MSDQYTFQIENYPSHRLHRVFFAQAIKLICRVDISMSYWNNIFACLVATANA